MGARWEGGVRPAEEHLPVVIGCRRKHAQADGATAVAALKRAGFVAAPIGTIAVASLAVVRLRAAALGLPMGELRDSIIDQADQLERTLPELQQHNVN